jgi:hypothetical protein
MAICPFADTRWLIPPGASDPRITPRIAILHTDGGNVYNLGPYFDGPSGGIESHFHVAKDGHLFQYRDTDWEADANYRANPFAISIETQGTGYEEWTPGQIETICRLLTWLNKTHAIPLRMCNRWDGEGIGYHIQFGSPGMWTPTAKICPGPKRIAQIGTHIIPGLRGDWFDMATEEELRRIIREEVGSAQIVVDVQGKGAGDDVKQPLNWVLRRLLNDEENIKAALENRTTAIKNAIIQEVQRLSASNTSPSGEVTPEQIEAAVEKGLRDVLGSLG